MGLRCSRFSCTAEAVASMQFDVSILQAVIIDLGPRTAGMPLCAAHAETRTPPVGWEIIDHRTGAGHTTWESPEAPSADVVAERPAKRRPDSGAAPEDGKDHQFTFKDTLDADETPNELDAASPLLSRAFRAANG